MKSMGPVCQQLPRATKARLIVVAAFGGYRRRLLPGWLFAEDPVVTVQASHDLFPDARKVRDVLLGQGVKEQGAD
jgi:hypothetical protein